jgi:RimJ/RimL family protein N-acetyltransferase
MVPPDVIELSRVRLRRPRPSDAEALFECASDLELARYMDWPVTTSMSELKERIGQREKRWVSGEEFYWVIALPNEDRAIGAIACRVDKHAADFGFFVNRRYWRKGYATEAAQAVVDWAMSVPNVWRVWATCDVENVASARVLQKVGLSCEGTSRRSIVRPNLSHEPRDSFVYSKVRGSAV